MLEHTERLADAVLMALKRAGLEVNATPAEGGPSTLWTFRPECVLLNAPPNDSAGVAVCRELRQSCAVPIIVLSSNGNREHGVPWLQAGADDFIPRPLLPADVLARIRAVLRRRQLDRGGTRLVRRVGDLELDYRHQRVTLNGVPVPLTATEFQVLSLLAEEPGMTRSRSEIMEYLGREVPRGDERACDVHISHLRRKLEGDVRGPQRILTVRGAGYVLTTRPARG